MGILSAWRAGKRLASPDPKIRAAAIDALASHDAPNALAKIEPLLLDPDPDVVKAAAERFAWNGKPQAAAALVKAVRAMLLERLAPATPSDDERRQSLRLEALVKVMRASAGIERASGGLAPLWVIAVRNRPHETRAGRFLHDGAGMAQIVEIVGLARVAEAVEPVRALLGDPTAEIRAAAASALGLLMARRTVETLIAALADAHAIVRDAAGEALGRIGDKQAVPALEALHGRATSRAVTGALKALGWTPNASAAIIEFGLANRDLALVASVGGEGLRPLLRQVWLTYGIDNPASNDAQGMARQIKNVMKRIRSLRELPDGDTLSATVKAITTAMESGKAPCKAVDLKMVAALPDLRARFRDQRTRSYLDDDFYETNRPDYIDLAIDCAPLRSRASALLGAGG